MTEHSSAQISEPAANDSALTPGAAAAAVCLDTELVTLIEERFAAWRLSREVDDDEVDAVYDKLDVLDALIAATPARTLGGIRLKAAIFHAIARDVELAWPMLRSILVDLQRVPLDDVALLRSVFAELATPLPQRWKPDPADGNL